MPIGAAGSPEKRALEESRPQKGCLTEGQSHQPPFLIPGLPPWLRVFCHAAQTWHPPPSDWLSPQEPGRAEGCPETT